jgi:hypothetical protein
MSHARHLLRVLMAVCIAAAAGTVRAATFDVDDTAFLPDAVPGDGVCAASSGACTLWAAVDEANALAGRDTVNVPAGNYLTNPDTYGHAVSIRDDLDLVGSGADVTVIDANRPLDPPWWYIRVIALDPGKSATVSGFTITNGSIGIDNYGDLTLIDSVVTRTVGLQTSASKAAVYCASCAHTSSTTPAKASTPPARTIFTMNPTRSSPRSASR